MACAGFLQSLWEKPIREGVWPYLDPMDGVCLRTASVEWNVPEKCGRAPFRLHSEGAGDGAGKFGRKTKVCLLVALEKAKWGNNALHVIGLYGPGGKISLFLQDWELAKGGLELPHGPGHAVPGNA